MKKQKILDKIECINHNIKNIQKICENECDIRKKILYKVFIPEISDNILDFIKKAICYKHQEELYEQNLLLDVYNKRL